MNDLEKEKAEKLADKGFEYLQDEEFERALEVSNELQEEHFSAAFDIGAQAYVGLEQYDKAIELLKKGIELAPQAWPNWQLLGNYLSDQNEFEEAQNAYDKALECDDAWVDSLYLNKAILLSRMGKNLESLKVSKLIGDKSLYIQKSEVEIIALIELSLYEEAKALANKILSIKDFSERDNEALGRVAAKIGRINLKQGAPKQEVRTFTFNSLVYDQNNQALLSLIRDIDNLYSIEAKYYRVMVHCQIPKTSPEYNDVKGYYCSYDVIALNEDHLLSFVQEFEKDEVSSGEYFIEEIEVIEKNTKDPCGVYFRSGRSFYKNL